MTMPDIFTLVYSAKGTMLQEVEHSSVFLTQSNFQEVWFIVLETLRVSR